MGAVVDRTDVIRQLIGIIGIIGICGWGGMAINAAAIDTRIKATSALLTTSMKAF